MRHGLYNEASGAMLDAHPPCRAAQGHVFVCEERAMRANETRSGPTECQQCRPAPKAPNESSGSFRRAGLVLEDEMRLGAQDWRIWRQLLRRDRGLTSRCL